MAGTLSGLDRKNCPMRNYSNGKCLICNESCFTVCNELCVAIRRACDKVYNVGYRACEYNDLWDKPLWWPSNY